MRRLLPLALLLLPLAPRATPDVETAATDRAHEALAAGDPGRAAAVVRQALDDVGEPAAEARLRCLLGAALLADDAPEDAERAVRDVPLDAPCGVRAGFLRAEALARLGRTDEAVALFDALGADRLGDDRDGPTAEAFASLARRLFADPDRGLHHGVAILADAAQLRVSAERRASLAREAVRAGHARRPDAPFCDALVAALATREDRADRVLAATTCPEPAARLLAGGLPEEDPERLALLADLAWAPEARNPLLHRAVAGGAAPSVRQAFATRLATEGSLDALPLLDADGGPGALHTRIDLLHRAGRTTDALAAADAWLAAFPTDPQRSQVEGTRAALLLDLARSTFAQGRHSDALTHYDALLATGSAEAPVAAWEAGVAARALGLPADARRRWEEAIARWPGTEGAVRAVQALARQVALDEVDPERAFDLLRRRAGDSGAVQEADRLREGAVWIETRGARVRVGARNLAEVELRLHHIDIEAFVRGGGRPEALADLDVAVIAPDRAWTVPVPGGATVRDVAFDVPVDAGPGLWSVTVASREDEAKALLLVSDLAVTARVVGRDVAVATFDADGRPVGGARILLVADGQVEEGRTDGTGLFTAPLPGAAPVVLAEKGGSSALTVLDPVTHPGPAQADDLFVTTELDRPVHLPGDDVALRLVARDGDGRPVTGPWEVWVGDGAHTAADADEHGALELALELPPVGHETFGGHPQVTGRTIHGLPPGRSQPIALAVVRAAPRDTGGRSVSVRLDGTDAVAEVRGPDGEPVAGVPLEGWGGRATTDAAGRARIAGPPAHLPWAVYVQITGTRASADAHRHAPAARLALRVREDRLRPGEAPALEVEGEARFDVSVARLEDLLAAPAPVADPWVEVPEVGLRGWRSWAGHAPPEPERLERTVWRGTGSVAGRGPLALGVPLEPGRWVVRVSDRDGRAAASAEVTVGQGLRLQGARDVRLGEELRLVPDGAPALLTAESDRLLFAAVRPAGKAVVVPVDPAWRGAVTLAATGPDGTVHARVVDADPTVDVDLEVVPEGGAFRVRATVRDGAGRPVRGRVSLAAWDLRLESRFGPADALDPWGLHPFGGSGSQGGGWGIDLQDGAEGDPIAPALLAEEALRREREHARTAGASGLLSDNALARALMGDVPVALGGLGAMGVGAGGAGYGFGGGSFGSKGAGGIGAVGGDGAPLPGVRERVLWTVLETDPAGAVSARFDGPPARWRVRATAVARDGLGVATGEADGRKRPWLVVHGPTPGLPGDRAAPWVHVVNGTDAPLEGTLRIGDERHPVRLGPGEAGEVLGAPREAGPRPVPVALSAAERTLAEGVFAFPLVEGAPDPSGPLTVVASGLAAVALRDDPAAPSEPWRLAIAGRAAIAALGRGHDPALLRGIRGVRDGLPGTGLAPTAADGAQQLLFLAEARDAGALDVADADLRRAAATLRDPVTRADRLWTAAALGRAGLEVDPDLLAVLANEGLTPEEAARVRGEALPADPAALLRAGPPPPGDPSLPDWIAAVATVHEDLPGPAAVMVHGGEVAVPAGALAWRAGVPASGEVHVVAERLPAGADGRLIRPAASAVVDCDPCRLQVGDALAGLPLRPGDRSSGLRIEPDRRDAPVLRAVAPGTFTVAGLRTDDGLLRARTVEVLPSDPGGPLSAGAAVVRARHRVAAGLEPDLPAFDAPPELVRQAARIAFDAALATGDDRAIAERFRVLAATDRGAEVPLSDVRRAARALRAIGDPEASLRVWRAGLDAAFLAEAAGISSIEPDAGLLVAVQRVREAALRYPDGRAVGDALYLLPARLLQMGDEGLPPEVEAAGITATDLRLTAAAWDREFLALHPDHRGATAAGLRLARTLLGLDVPEAAATWADRVARSHGDDPLLDGLTWLEALARTEAGETAAAEPDLRRVAERPFPDASGVPGPSVHQADALLVLGRLYEARGQLGRALAVYDGLPTPAAERAAEALRVARLELPEVVRLGPGEPTVVPAEVQGVGEALVRAYRVDLRTLFLRDGGLSTAERIAVAGVSPEWSGTRALGGSAFPSSRDLPLPLAGEGAWLVQVSAERATAEVLVVRSALALSTTDAGGVRRVAIERGGRPAVGVEVRALDGGLVVAATTDVRGVAEVPDGASVLAWDDGSWAFTDPTGPGVEPAGRPGEAPEGLDALLRTLDARIEGRRSEDTSAWSQRYAGPARESLALDAL